MIFPYPCSQLLNYVVNSCLLSNATATQRSATVARSSLVVEAKQNAKQRERLSEAERVYNKARKSAVATRIRKVGFRDVLRACVTNSPKCVDKS